jgi:lysophospholipase L1-like esterase
MESPQKVRPSLEQQANENAPDNGLSVNAEIREAMKTDEGPQDENPGKDGDTPGTMAETTARKTWDSGRSGSSDFTGSVSAIGDSVMLGAVRGLQKDIHGLTVIDAEVGLQVYAATDTLRYRRASGQLGDVVIVHLGNNGTFTKGQFDEIMRILSGVDRVLFVNVTVPRAWEEPNNEVISEGVGRYPNAVLADWYSASVDHPEYFVEDGVHLQIKGQKVYAALIADQIKAP